MLTPAEIQKVRAAAGVPPVPTNGVSLTQKLRPVPIQPQQPSGTFAEQATFPATGTESPIGIAGHVVGNIPSSAVNFGKGLVSLINPINIAHTAERIGTEAGEALNEGQDAKTLALETVKGLPQATYETVVPKFLQHLVEGDTTKSAATLENDPVGQILPLLMVARTAAVKSGKGLEFDQGISKAASPVTSIGSSVKNFTGKVVSGTSKFSASQATGLSSDTLKQIIENPDHFTEVAQHSISRSAIAQDVASAIETRINALSETGKGYNEIRKVPGSVSVPEGTVTGILAKYGLGVGKKGEIISNAESRPVTAIDKTAIERFIKTFGDGGTYSNNAILNAREMLSQMAKYEQGKTGIPEMISRDLRSIFDDAAKSEIPEPTIGFTGNEPVTPKLVDIDKTYSPEVRVLNRAKQDFLQKSGEGYILKDAAINRIANATGKGKDMLLKRLEELSPGLGDKVRYLKAVEDIQNLSNQIPGKYGRAGLFLGAAYAFNPWLIIGTVMSLPELAVPILRGIGMSQAKIKPFLDSLGVRGKGLTDSALNFSPLVPGQQQSPKEDKPKKH